MKKNMLLTLEVPEMEVVEFANSTDPGAAAQLIWVNNICLLVIVEFRDKATALNEARSFIDFRGRSFCPSEQQIRPSLKNCMFAVLLPIIFEVGR